MVGEKCASDCSAHFSAASGMSSDNVVAAFSPPGLCGGYPLMSAFVPPREKIAAHLFWMEKSHV